MAEADSPMLELLLNVVIIAIVAAPLGALEWLRKYSRWIDDKHDTLSIVLWFATLVLVYTSVLPRLHMVPNPRFFDADPPGY